MNKKIFILVLFMFLFLNFFCPLVNAGYNISSDYVSWWRFEGNANDESGINNGTVIGAIYNATGGRFGGAYEFNGSSTINMSSPVIPPDNFTISSWINVPAYNKYHGVIQQYIPADSGRLRIEIWLTDGTVHAQIGTNHCNTLNAVGTGWHLLSFVKNSSNFFIYRDGALNISCAYSGTVMQSANTIIGLGPDGGLNGSVDEVIIYNRTLSESEILQLYQMQILNATPQIDFINPTPANGTITTNTSFEINVSIIEANLSEVIYNWNSTNFTIYDESLILMMNLDNKSSLGENDTYAVDVSSYSNNGTISNGVLSSGKYGGGLELNGSGDYINIPDSPIFDTGSQITTSAWIKSNISEQSGIGILLHDNSRYKWLLYFTGANTSDSVSFYVNTSSGVTSASCAYSEGAVANNEWHLLTGTYDQSSGSKRVKMYYDGIVCGSANGYDEPITEGDEGVWIGRWGSKSFNGSIDEVRVWNRSLSADEVYQQYISNFQKFNSTQWYLYVNQSKNTTAGLDDGDYTYQVFAEDNSGNSNQTKQRIITIDTSIAGTPSETGGSSGGGGGGTRVYDCVKTADCAEGLSCFNHKCLKLFDAEILNVNSVINSLNFDLEYFIKGVAELNSDVVIKFWIQNSENPEKKIELGKDTIYLSSFEEKTKKINLNLPYTIENGTYDLYFSVSYGNYSAESFRKISIEVYEVEKIAAKEEAQRNFAIRPASYLLMAILILIIGFILYRSRKLNPSFNFNKTFLAIKQKIANIILFKFKRAKFKGEYQKLSDFVGREVYSEEGNFIGRVEEIILAENRIYGWLIVLNEYFYSNQTVKKVLIKNADVKARGYVLIVDNGIENNLRTH